MVQGSIALLGVQGARIVLLGSIVLLRRVVRVRIAGLAMREDIVLLLRVLVLLVVLGSIKVLLVSVIKGGGQWIERD